MLSKYSSGSFPERVGSVIRPFDQKDAETHGRQKENRGNLRTWRAGFARQGEVGAGGASCLRRFGSNDSSTIPMLKRARDEGYRGRAAFKIMEIDDKFRFLVPGARVVDLGCAPGGWCQVAVKRVNALGEKSGKKIGTILGVDLQEVEPIAGTEIHQLDFMEDDADQKVKDWLGGEADVVMSDMAAASSGHKQTDHLRIMAPLRGGGLSGF